MGGNTAQEITFLMAERVESLVLIDCACNTMKLSRLEEFYLKITPFLLPLYPWKYLVEQSVKASSIKPEVQKYLQEVFQTVGRKDFGKIFLETAACLHYEESYRMNKPILLVCGEHDHTGNIKKVAPIWAQQELDCEFHMIKDAGHCSNQDNPQEFNALLGQFLCRDKQKR